MVRASGYSVIHDARKFPARRDERFQGLDMFLVDDDEVVLGLRHPCAILAKNSKVRPESRTSKEAGV